MSSKIKINLSPRELRVLGDESFFHTKVEVTHKIYSMFSLLINKIQSSVPHQNFKYPEQTDLSLGKISKGENYKSLPYIVVDFPRYFKKPDMLVYRAMLWWGKYFIFTLHLSGSCATEHKAAFLENYTKLNPKNTFFCISKKQWEHAITKRDYKRVDKLTRDEIEACIEANGFIKISRKLSLKNYKKFLDRGSDTFEEFLSSLMPQQNKS